MEFLEVLRNRYSCRSYDSGRPVPLTVLEQIAAAGAAAPSACNLQPWQMLFISSSPLLDQVRSCYGSRWIDTAPHILVVKGSRSSAWVRGGDGYNSLETDLTIIMDHLILAAENYGVCSCWIAAFNYQMLRSVLGLGPDEEIFAITPLGYPADERKSDNRSASRRKSLAQTALFI